MMIPFFIGTSSILAQHQHITQPPHQEKTNHIGSPHTHLNRQQQHTGNWIPKNDDLFLFGWLLPQQRQRAKWNASFKYTFTHISPPMVHIQREENTTIHIFFTGMYNVYWIQPDTTRSVTFTQANVGVSLVCVLCVMGECESHPPSSLLVWSARKSMKESLLDRLANQHYY